MPPAPRRSRIRLQPSLLLEMLRDSQPVLDQLRAEHGPVVSLDFGPAKMAIVSPSRWAF